MQRGTEVQPPFSLQLTLLCPSELSDQRYPILHFTFVDDPKLVSGGDPETYSIFQAVTFPLGSPQSDSAHQNTFLQAHLSN